MFNFLWIGMACLYAFAIHPFYVSLTDIKINSNQSVIEWSQRVFIDDIEAALSKNQNTHISLSKEIESKKAENLVRQYFQKHTSIIVNGVNLPLRWLGYEREEDVLWIYMETNFSEKIDEIKVRNRILMDDFPAQQNIINIYKGKKPTSQILTKENDTGKWTELR
jgi:hypothetical protein